MGVACLRLQQYPRGLGKGHDCALLHKWLKSVLDGLEPTDVPASWQHASMHISFCSFPLFRACVSSTESVLCVGLQVRLLAGICLKLWNGAIARAMLFGVRCTMGECGWQKRMLEERLNMDGTWRIFGQTSSKTFSLLGRVFLTQEAYGACASLAASCSWKLYYLRPKNHMFLHITCHSCSLCMISGVKKILVLGESYSTTHLDMTMCWTPCVGNLVCIAWTLYFINGRFWGHACWADEDYIGRVSRTSRKTHSLLVSFRTISKTLMNYKYEWGKICPRSPHQARVRWDPDAVNGCAGNSRAVKPLGTRENNSNTFFQNVRILEWHGQDKLEH